jgi:hypothetical protein
MTRDDIIRMAREAGLHLYVNDLTEEPYALIVERFASLVAAAERESCLDLCYTIGNEFKEEWAEHNEDRYWERCLGAGECADAIRAREQE